MDTTKLFDEKSDLYASARPHYPKELFEYIFQQCRGLNAAWDCGTGNGQAALGLAQRFKHVYATDISENQIDNAFRKPSIEYLVMPAEQPVFADNSLDLVAVAQALHWFDLSTYWHQVTRVAKPGALFVAWGYGWFNVTSVLDKLILKTVREVIDPYWAKNNQLLINGYKDVNFPFQPLDCPNFSIHLSWNLDELFAFMHSWSATRRCIEARGSDFFENAYQQCKTLWGDTQEKKAIEMPLTVIMQRIK